MTKSIKTRLAELENKHPDRPLKAIFQDWDDPTLWHDKSRQWESPAYTWDQIKAKYPDHDFIQVLYAEDWKGGSNESD